MKRKNISLSGPLEFGLCPLTVVDFSEQELNIYTGGVALLGVKVGKNKFTDVIQNGDFVKFQNGISFQLENEERVALYRVGKQLEIKKIERSLV